jgi:hypothetical protein
MRALPFVTQFAPLIRFVNQNTFPIRYKEYITNVRDFAPGD